MNNNIYYKVWEIIYPLRNLNVAAVEEWEWISIFFPRLCGIRLLNHAGIEVNQC